VTWKKSNLSDLSKECLAQFHQSTGFLLEPFRDPDKFYELFVHGFVKTKVFSNRYDNLVIQMNTIKYVVSEEGMGNTDFIPVEIVQLLLLLTWIIQNLNANHGL
jgi:hypothetical protein